MLGVQGFKEDNRMARSFGTDRSGRSFSEAVKLAVWSKALGVPGFNLAEWRQDSCGARIQWSKHGDTTPQGFGWEVDHMNPVANGGSDSLSNLQVLQWENNRRKSDITGSWTCAIKYA